MAGRRPQAPPPIESRVFTAEEIAQGVRKLKRRIDEVKAIDSKKVRFDDAAVKAASRNIHADIGDIFGRNSPEYHAHGDYSISFPTLIMGRDDYYYQQEFTGHLPDAVTMLESLITRLEENARIWAAIRRPACE